MHQQIKTGLGTAVIIIFAITAGVFVWLSEKGNPVNTDVQVVKTNPVNGQATTVQPANETANWQTYRNEKYGFEVKYPKNWFATEYRNAIKDNTNMDALVGFDSRVHSDFIASESAVGRVSVQVIKTPLAQILQSSKKEFENFSQDQANVNGIVMTKITGQLGENSINPGQKQLSVAFEYQGKTFIIIPYDITNETDIIFNQILSTFKFTSNSNVSVATEKQIGYIKKVYEKNGKKYLNIDYVQFLQGDEAKGAALDDKKCTQLEFCAPNGYFRNQNPQLRTFEISEDAQIYRATAFDYSPTGIKPINFGELSKLLVENDGRFAKFVPFNIEIVKNQVLKITEQFIP